MGRPISKASVSSALSSIAMNVNAAITTAFFFALTWILLTTHKYQALLGVDRGCKQDPQGLEERQNCQIIPIPAILRDPADQCYEPLRDDYYDFPNFGGGGRVSV